jgi:hypothetical protein
VPFNHEQKKGLTNGLLLSPEKEGPTMIKMVAIRILQRKIESRPRMSEAFYFPMLSEVTKAIAVTKSNPDCD